MRKTDEIYGPIVKWAGGKSKLATIIEEKILESTDLSKIETYVEPFIGGGSFFFYLAQKYEIKNKIISDINAELVNLYKVVQQIPENLIENANSLQKEYNEINSLEAKKEFFYRIRTRYNETIENMENLDLDVEQAVLFLFLNKVGFNGLYRVNSRGLYNVPFGQREKANLFKESNILGVSELLKDVKILNCGYDKTIDFAQDKSFFYFDPPYRPLSDSASFTSYAKSSFNDEDQIKLAEFCKLIDAKGARFALSNSDPKNHDLEDNFFDELFQDFRISRISAHRMIGAKAISRGKVSEILVIN